MAAGFRYRLTLWHAVSTVAILVILVAVADWALSRLVMRQVDSVLLTLAQTEAAWVFEQVASAHLHELTGLQGSSSLEMLMQVVDQHGNVLVRTLTLGDSSLPAPDTVLSRVRAGETVIETISMSAGERIRLVSIPLPAGSDSPYALQVATSLQSMEGFLSMTRWLMLGISALLLQAVVLLGFVLTGRVLRPIDEVVVMARQIGGQTRGQRLPHPGTDDEFGRLVATLNEMLERLDRGVEAHQRFTANAAHELRTPLSRMCADLEIALRRPRSAEQYEEIIRSSLGDAERLSKLTATLLALARLDAGEGRDDLPSASSDVLEVIQGECESLQAEADERSISLVLEPSPCLAVAMPPEFLRLLFGNIIGNAVKFSSCGGKVVIHVGMSDGEAILTVADSGPEIPEARREQIFQRFYRSDSARSSETPGFGLGLSICRVIVEVYGGMITVASGARDGNVFTVRLPLVEETSALASGSA